MVKLDRLSYPACTLQYNGKQCNKKVDDSGGGDGPDRWCAVLFCWDCSDCRRHGICRGVCACMPDATDAFLEARLQRRIGGGYKGWSAAC